MDMHGNRMLRKVPEITLIFWITKVLTTAVGESTSDFFVFKINPYVAVTLGGFALLVALALQFAVRKYLPWVYWLAVAMVAVFGTMAADVLHIEFKIPYVATTIFFAIILAVVFIVWHRTEKILSIHSINTPRREFFYWATVLSTFALGTAAGDMTASTLGLGYFSSGLLFASLIVIPALAYWLFNTNEVLTFWVAYILTRPLGASFADWTGKSKSVGALGWGDGPVALGLTALIVICVLYMMLNRRESKRERIVHYSNYTRTRPH
jgi:uncharacterized membrane-anchored protein